MYLNNSKYSSRMVQLRKECEERIGESTEAALLEALSAAKPTIGKFRSRRKNKKNSKLRPPGVAEHESALRITLMILRGLDWNDYKNYSLWVEIPPLEPHQLQLADVSLRKSGRNGVTVRCTDASLPLFEEVPPETKEVPPETKQEAPPETKPHILDTLVRELVERNAELRAELERLQPYLVYEALQKQRNVRTTCPECGDYNYRGDLVGFIRSDEDTRPRCRRHGAVRS
jgi:hypothetical protein